MECFPMECDVREPNAYATSGNSENDANAEGCCCQIDSCQGGKKSFSRSPKVNDIPARGVLRYALHLRFPSPFSKNPSKSRQHCKLDLSSELHTRSRTEEERRFYLYNDIRVVFPQRQSDSDKGKVRGN